MLVHREGAELREGGGVGRDLALEVSHGGGEGLVGGDEGAEAPAGHGVALGVAGDGDGQAGGFRREGRRAAGGLAVIDEVLVDLVGHDPHVGLHADGHEGFELGAGIDGAGRVGRAVDDDHARLRGERGGQLGRGDLETGDVLGVDDDGRSAGELNHLRVAHPIRGRNDDFVAGADRGEDGEVAGHLATRGDDDVGVGDAGEAATGVVLGDGLAEGGDARRGGILGLAVGQGLGAGVLDELRGVEVGLADAEADDVLAGGLEGLRLGIDGEGR